MKSWLALAGACVTLVAGSCARTDPFGPDEEDGVREPPALDDGGAAPDGGEGEPDGGEGDGGPGLADAGDDGLPPHLDRDGDGVRDSVDNCPFIRNPAQADADICVWPNKLSKANSDGWLSQHHDQLQLMRPRFLVLNFANGIGQGGNDNVSGGPLTAADVQRKAQGFLDALSRGSRHREAKHRSTRAFLEPELVKVVNLQDGSSHANSALFPRGKPDAQGCVMVGYHQLFSSAFAWHYGFYENGRYLTLGELVDRGLVHEVILMANQVDCRAPNPPALTTHNILEVAFTAQAYDVTLRKLDGEFVKNGIANERQKVDMAQATAADHNSMPWSGRSLRIYFFNASRGAGCLLHSLGHEFEFRYNESTIYSPGRPAHGRSPHPWLQPLFRRFADFDMKARYGAPFNSLYEGDQKYGYSACDGGVCRTLGYFGGGFGTGTVPNYRPSCGNTHYPPGAAEGYDYLPRARVLSSCEGFLVPDAGASPFGKDNWAHVASDPSVDEDCGGKFLVYWYQQMPGLSNAAVDLAGRPMKNWWPFMYY